MSTLEELRARGESVLMNTYRRQPLVLVSGHGVRVIDGDGRELIDLVGGLAVTTLGHAHPALRDALDAQSARLVHTSNLYWTEPQVELAERLVASAFPARVFFCNSGAEANETAIKIARKWGRAHRGGAAGVVTLHGGFHGRTLGALAATANPAYRAAFEPLPPGFTAVAPTIDAITGAIDAGTAAVMLEPIQGESGVIPLGDDLLRAVRSLCDERDVLLILDEVQTGIGRTGRMWAHQHAGITPDVMTVAKGLGGGVPIGAVLAAPRADVLEPGDHGSTFGGTPLATAAAIAVLRTLESERLVENAAHVGDYLHESLTSLRSEGVPITEVRGRGLMQAVVLGEPVAQRWAAAALDAGVIVNAIGDSVVRLLPPLVLTTADVDEAVGRLSAAWTAVQAEART